MNLQHAKSVEDKRVFYNSRFSRDVHSDQAKYYASIGHGARYFDRRVLALAKSRHVLEYGCGTSLQGAEVAGVARTVTGIDISDVAIANANAAVTARNLRNIGYLTMDAEEMSFRDNSFDLIFGRGILHHLDLDRCFAGMARVLRPGGRAIFWEPLGHNPVLRAYRNRTPDVRTIDEHPLVKSDFDLARRHLDIGALKFYGLTTIASVPVRNTVFGDIVLKAAATVDDILFLSPARWLAWHCYVEFHKR